MTERIRTNRPLYRLDPAPRMATALRFVGRLCAVEHRPLRGTATGADGTVYGQVLSVARVRGMGTAVLVVRRSGWDDVALPLAQVGMIEEVAKSR